MVATPPPAVRLPLAEAMVAYASSPLVLLDGNLDVVAVSISFCRAFDVDFQRAVGRSMFALEGGGWDSPRLRSLLAATVGGGAEIDAYEFDLRTRGHGVRCLVLNAHKLDYDDPEGVRLLLAATDVTDARARERQHDDLVNDKAVLMRELQHRVANSLQIVASVLLQGARKASSDETRIHLTDAHHRVMSVAAVQRHLAVSATGMVALNPYLTQLCNSIGASMIHDHNQLTLTVAVDSSQVAAETSVSIGLIVTELVINALKHAFPDNRRGTIGVDYRSDRADWVLSIADDGVGMSKNASDNPPGLGTAIVEALAKQLHATIAVADRNPGTEVKVSHDDAVDARRGRPVLVAV